MKLGKILNTIICGQLNIGDTLRYIGKENFFLHGEVVKVVEKCRGFEDYIVVSSLKSLNKGKFLFICDLSYNVFERIYE